MAGMWFFAGLFIGVLVMFIGVIETHRKVYRLSAKDAWRAAWAGLCMRPLPEREGCVECGGGPCRVWRGNIVAGSLGMDQMQNKHPLVPFNFPGRPCCYVCGQNKPIRVNRKGQFICNDCATSCSCQVAHEGECQSNISQGELLQKVTKPSPNCNSNLPDSEYED